MSARGLLLAVVTAVCGCIAVSGSFVSSAVAEEACPNAQLRTGYAAALPDCRGYERVSPPGVEPDFEVSGPDTAVVPEGGYSRDGAARDGVHGSVSGDRVAFSSIALPAGYPSDGEYLLSTRSSEGWSTREMIPPQSPDYSVLCQNAYIVAYSPDLSRSILGDGASQPGSADHEGSVAAVLMNRCLCLVSRRAFRTFSSVKDRAVLTSCSIRWLVGRWVPRLRMRGFRGPLKI